MKSTLSPRKTVSLTVNLSSNFITFVLLLAVKVLFPVSLVVKLTVLIKVPVVKVLNVIVKFALSFTVKLPLYLKTILVKFAVLPSLKVTLYVVTLTTVQLF